MLDQQHLNNYFSGAWRQRDRGFDQYHKTGWALIDRVKSGESVIDVGCGSNPFKGRLDNLVGVDPAFSEADVQLSLEDYFKQTDSKFDVAFCLGSINFGSVEDIEHQIGLVDKLLAGQGSRIYWRCNPGRKDHGNKECEDILFYPWSFNEHIRLSDKFGYKLLEVSWDNNNRIYAEWIKL
jgi:hypothetical protein